MLFALAQIDTTVGDHAGNAALIIAAAEEAAAAGARLVVFPELAVTGYPPRDLLDRPAFVAATRAATNDLARRLPEGITALVGTVEPSGASAGRPLVNVAALLQRGAPPRVVGRKCLLPTYDVFDEDRYFEPADRAADPFEVDGLPLGVVICEDMWTAEGPMAGDDAGRRHRRDPVADAVAIGARAILVISASPFDLGKPAVREELLSGHARRHGVPMLLCNLVGGNDDLVFDGRSLAVDARGELVARGAHAKPDLVLVEVTASGDRGAGRVTAGAPGDASAPRPAREDDANELLAAILVLGTADYVRKCGFGGAIVGLSGGIDSALTAAIAARALGRENVVGVSMPSRFSSAGSRDDARALAENLGIELREVPIEPIFASFLDGLAPVFGDAPFDVTEENLQARTRGALLMAISNKTGRIVLTTGNKSELAVGYCTLYGDMCGGLAVISDLPKTLVYELAIHWNRDGEVIPVATIEKPPSAELRPDQRDEDSLPPYEVLDAILAAYIERHEDPAAIAARGFDRAVVDDVIRKVDRNEYKRNQAAPGLRVTSKAFGTGRRYPIAQRYGH